MTIEAQASRLAMTDERVWILLASHNAAAAHARPPHSATAITGVSQGGSSPGLSSQE